MQLNSDTCPENEQLRWYVVQTLPRREALALRHLRNQKFNGFCPMRRRPKRGGRLGSFALEPFFQSYLFVQMDPSRQQWRSINGTIGVTRLVGSSDRLGMLPPALPRGLVERFQQLSRQDGSLSFAERLGEGAAVRIVGGPFDRLSGVLESAGRAERVTVLLNLLTQETRVQLSRDMLIAA